jgi:polyhydroxybutyrate depolymerase
VKGHPRKGQPGDTVPGDPDTAGDSDTATVTTTGELTVGGRQRPYLVVRPATVAADATLVMVLHGSKQTGPKVRSFSGHTFDDLAARHGAVVVYPDAVGGLWNDARRATPGRAKAEGVDDVAFLSELARHISHDLGAGRRVVVAGYSNGGQMAIRMLHEVPELLTAVVLVGATQPTHDNLAVTDRRGAVPVLMIHGTKDPIVPYQGGMASLFGFRPRGTGLSAEASADYFAARNGITAAATEPTRLPHAKESRGTTVTRYRRQQEGRLPVELYTVHGGGHVVPNPRKRAFRLLGRTTRDVDTGELLWGFVSPLNTSTGP